MGGSLIIGMFQLTASCTMRESTRDQGIRNRGASRVWIALLIQHLVLRFGMKRHIIGSRSDFRESCRDSVHDSLQGGPEQIISCEVNDDFPVDTDAAKQFDRVTFVIYKGPCGANHLPKSEHYIFNEV
jgi:hypothetical protein